MIKMGAGASAAGPAAPATTSPAAAAPAAVFNSPVVAAFTLADNGETGIPKIYHSDIRYDTEEGIKGLFSAFATGTLPVDGLQTVWFGESRVYNIYARAWGSADNQHYTVWIDNRKPYKAAEVADVAAGSPLLSAAPDPPDDYGIEFTVTHVPARDGSPEHHIIDFSYMYFGRELGVYVKREDRISVKELFRLFALIHHRAVKVCDLASIHYYMVPNKALKLRALAESYAGLTGMTRDEATVVRDKLTQDVHIMPYTALKALEWAATGEDNIDWFYPAQEKKVAPTTEPVDQTDLRATAEPVDQTDLRATAELLKQRLREIDDNARTTCTEATADAKIQALLNPTQRFWKALFSGRDKEHLPVVQSDEYIEQVQTAIRELPFGFQPETCLIGLSDMQAWTTPARQPVSLEQVKQQLREAGALIREAEEATGRVEQATHPAGTPPPADRPLNPPLEATHSAGTPPPAESTLNPSLFQLKF